MWKREKTRRAASLPNGFGLPIARTMPGYSFAVFAREVSLGHNSARNSGGFLPIDSNAFPGLAKMDNQLPPAGDRRLCHGS